MEIIQQPREGRLELQLKGRFDANWADHVGSAIELAIRAGHHCAQPLMEHLGVPATARASFGIYNGLEDVAALARGIERVTRIFR